MLRSAWEARVARRASYLFHGVVLRRMYPRMLRTSPSTPDGVRPSQMVNGDPESSVSDGSPVSLVGPTLNRYRASRRPDGLSRLSRAIVSQRSSSDGIRCSGERAPASPNMINGSLDKATGRVQHQGHRLRLFHTVSR